MEWISYVRHCNRTCVTYTHTHYAHNDTYEYLEWSPLFPERCAVRGSGGRSRSVEGIDGGRARCFAPFCALGKGKIWGSISGLEVCVSQRVQLCVLVMFEPSDNAYFVTRFFAVLMAGWQRKISWGGVMIFQACTCPSFKILPILEFEGRDPRVARALFRVGDLYFQKLTMQVS